MAPGTLIGGKYRIVRLLGTGGMGAVYEARHELTEKRVAIKRLHPRYAERPEHVQRMLREAQASARIHHPNVVDVYDVGSEGDSLFLVMEYLEGETLAALLRRGLLTVREALAIAIPAMRGVAAGHALGIIHRDIKPDNIFLARVPDHRDPLPKVLDFGISKVPSLTGEELSLTESGATLGTPLYMSSEQLHGARDIDARADVYAFGVILYEALTGTTPYRADSLGGLAVLVATTDPARPSALNPSLPASVDEVILRAIARSREARFGSLDALIMALSQLRADGGSGDFGSAERDTLPSTAAVRGPVAPAKVASLSGATRARSGRSRAVLGTALVLGVLAAGYAWLRTGPGPEASPVRVPETLVRETHAVEGRNLDSAHAQNPDAPSPERAQGGEPTPARGTAQVVVPRTPNAGTKAIQRLNPRSPATRVSGAAAVSSDPAKMSAAPSPSASVPEPAPASTPSDSNPVTPRYRAGKPNLDEF